MSVKTGEDQNYPQILRKSRKFKFIYEPMKQDYNE